MISARINNVLGRLEKVRQNGSGYQALCPGHEDIKPSLSINEGADGRVFLYCHAGCKFDSIIQSLGMSPRDLMPQNRSAANGSFNKMTIKKIYPYVDEQGRLLYENVRKEPKDFMARRPDGQGNYILNLNGTRRVLYRLLEVINSGKEILITEGEKDCDAAI